MHIHVHVHDKNIYDYIEIFGCLRMKKYLSKSNESEYFDTKIYECTYTVCNEHKVVRIS